MNDAPASTGPIPADDPTRTLTIARPDSDQSLRHLAMVGDTYTVLVSGDQTAGRYCLIDMLIPPGGGPAPHRHDFEEMFSILEGEVEFTFRGEKAVARAGETVNVPANAPHFFTNATDQAVRLLCLCSPAGQEQFFADVGEEVATRTAPAPRLDEAAQAAFLAKAEGARADVPHRTAKTMTEGQLSWRAQTTSTLARSPGSAPIMDGRAACSKGRRCR